MDTSDDQNFFSDSVSRRFKEKLKDLRKPRSYSMSQKTHPNLACYGGISHVFSTLN